MRAARPILLFACHNRQVWGFFLRPAANLKANGGYIKGIYRETVVGWGEMPLRTAGWI